MSARLPRPPAWTLAVGSMASVQLSAALSTGLIAQVGAGGTAWLRTTIGALVFVVLVRPSLRSVRRRDVPTLLALGATTGAMSVLFLAAIQRIPLGTAVAIEFLGPLTVAALGSRRPTALIWPGVALVGVVVLTDPWSGAVDPLGVLLAVLAALGWALYIRLTQRVGDRYQGVHALALTIPVAAGVTAVIGVPQAVGALTPNVLLVAAGLALLMPVLPFALEMLALQRMTAHAFGTLMALEPAFGVLLGALLLQQVPAPVQIGGVALVVLAGAAAQRGGTRSAVVSPDPGVPAPPPAP